MCAQNVNIFLKIRFFFSFCNLVLKKTHLSCRVFSSLCVRDSVDSTCMCAILVVNIYFGKVFLNDCENEKADMIWSIGVHR